LPCLEEQPPETPRHALQDPEMMLAFAWNPMGFHVLEMLAKCRIVNAEYYGDDMPMALLRPAIRSMGASSLLMQAIHDPTQIETVDPFTWKTRSSSTYINHAPLIWHHPLLSLRTCQALPAGNGVWMTGRISCGNL
jgi:hypothetical protein